MQKRFETIRQRGAALVMALFAAALLSFLTVTLLNLGRQQGERIRLLEHRLLLELGADSAMAEALYHLATGQPPLAESDAGADPETSWQSAPITPSSTPGERGLPDGAGELRLRVFDVSARLNPLNPPVPGLFQAYLRTKGVDQKRATAIEAELADWVEGDKLRHLNGAVARDYSAAGLSYVPRGDRQLQDVAELQLLRSMDETLYQRIAPELTLEMTDVIDLDSMPDDVVIALDKALGGNSLSEQSPETARTRLALLGHIGGEVMLLRGMTKTVRIEVEARLDTQRVGRWLEVRLQPDDQLTRPWSIIRSGVR